MTRRIAIVGVFTAMTVVATLFTRIPVPSLTQGYFNLGDAVVFTAAALSGGYTGAFAGAVGSALADVLTGGYLFAPVSLVVKGLMGYAVGRLAGKSAGAGGKLPASGAGTSGDSGGSAVGGGSTADGGSGNSGGRLVRAFFVGALIMAAGYFTAEATLLALIDRAFGFGAAVAELPVNLAQGALSVALARAAVAALKKTGIWRFT